LGAWPVPPVPSGNVQFSSLECAEAAEGEEDTIEADDASLNDAVLIDEIEGAEAEVIEVCHILS